MLQAPLTPAAADALAAAAERSGVKLRRSHIRLYDREGCVFTSDGLTNRSARSAGIVLISLSDEPLQLVVEGNRFLCGMVALKPFVQKELHAEHTPFACIDIAPMHPSYRVFNRIGGDGCLVFPRERFEPLAEALREFHRGTMTSAEAYRLHRRAANLVASTLPEMPPLDPRIERVLEVLHEHVGLSIEQLASRVALSPDHLSRLFSRQMGMPIRRYTRAVKIQAAARLYNSGLTLTEIAAAAHFTDLAHFSRVWTESYGTPPAYFFNSGAVASRPLPPPAAG